MNWFLVLENLPLIHLHCIDWSNTFTPASRQWPPTAAWGCLLHFMRIPSSVATWKPPKNVSVMSLQMIWFPVWKQTPCGFGGFLENPSFQGNALSFWASWSSPPVVILCVEEGKGRGEWFGKRRREGPHGQTHVHNEAPSSNVNLKHMLVSTENWGLRGDSAQLQTCACMFLCVCVYVRLCQAQ